MNCGLPGSFVLGFFERLQKHHIIPAQLKTTLIADLKSLPVPGKRKIGTIFEWDITCNIQTDEITYFGKKKKLTPGPVLLARLMELNSPVS